MPRDGTETYILPFPDVVEDTTIESTVYNGFTNDVAQDLNLPRPILAGGTGATSADAALFNLGGEKAAQLVTNYDSQLWVPGSFRSAAAATGAPNGTAAFAGVVYINEALANPPTNNNVVVEARDLTSGTRYTRRKTAGVWGTWSTQAGSTTELDAAYVNVTGDTMTGNLTITQAEPTLFLSKPTAAHFNSINGQTNGSARWIITLGDNIAESGSNVGSNFGISRFNDAGTVIDTPVAITRSTGLITMKGPITVTSSTASTSLITGSVITAGGVGISGDVHAAQIACAGATAGAFPGYFNTNTGISLASSTGGFLAVSRAGTPCAAFNINQDAQEIAFNRSGTTVGSVSVTTTATAFNTSSDERLKEDLRPFDAGSIIDSTSVYDFAWKTTGSRSYGVVAQQANEIYPAAVHYDKGADWWGIDYSKYVPVLLQELKALRERVAALETRDG